MADLHPAIGQTEAREALGGPASGGGLSLVPEFFQALLGRLEDPVFVKDARHRWLYANDAFCALLGRAPNEVIGHTDADCFPPEQAQVFYDGDDFVIRQGTSLTQEEQIGADTYALVKKAPIELPDGSIGLVGIIFDISEYRKVQLEVEKLRISRLQALCDPLTGLSNRRHLDAFFGELRQACLDGDERICLLHIDLDHFKEINDRHGHATGDAALIHVASVLRSEIGEGDLAARIGGDEFIVVGKRAQPAREAAELARHIADRFAEPMVHEGQTFALSASIGVAFDDASGAVEFDQMLRSADVALYQAKAAGRSRFEVFTPGLLLESMQRKRLRDEFVEALRGDGIFGVYQPQFDCGTLELIGVECLARWRHESRGILTPNVFLPVAAAENRLHELDFTVLRRAVDDMRNLLRKGINVPRFAVNVSAEFLADPELAAKIAALSPLPAPLSLELLESISFEEIGETVERNLEALRQAGIGIEIDDFGSGKTSIVGLLRVRPDRIKIDKRLIIPLDRSSQHRGLVKSIIDIADSLEIPTLAEGVESERHRQILAEIGCRDLQGFGFGKPMTITALVRFLGQRSAETRCRATGAGDTMSVPLDTRTAPHNATVPDIRNDTERDTDAWN